MYSRKNGLIIGFHGCDRELRDRIVSEKGITLQPSNNLYDWLGVGIYFWENNYERAFQFAMDLKNNPPKNKQNTINDPAVLGAVIDLGYCLDLMDTEYLKILPTSYEHLRLTHNMYGTELPKNIPDSTGDLLRRFLDCAVIETTHKLHESQGNKPFDSVRGVFFEGNELYPNAGFKEKNHIQIALRNPNCIKGYFIPREYDQNFSLH